MDNIKQYLLDDSNVILRQPSQDLDINNISDNEQKLINIMVKYIDCCYLGKAKECGIKEGIAIASNQVGLLKKVIYIHFNHLDKEYKYLLANPKIIQYSLQKVFLSSGEGCLSVKEKHAGYVPRYSKITVHAYDLLNKKEISIDASDLLSICLQHEIDHLSGKLYYDKINKIDPFYFEQEWIRI